METMTVITGDGIKIYQLLAIRGALWLESKGMKASRGPAVSTTVKKLLGITGNRKSLMRALELHIISVTGKALERRYSDEM